MIENYVLAKKTLAKDLFIAFVSDVNPIDVDYRDFCEEMCYIEGISIEDRVFTDSNIANFCSNFFLETYWEIYASSILGTSAKIEENYLEYIDIIRNVYSNILKIDNAFFITNSFSYEYEEKYYENSEQVRFIVYINISDITSEHLSEVTINVDNTDFNTNIKFFNAQELYYTKLIHSELFSMDYFTLTQLHDFVLSSNIDYDFRQIKRLLLENKLIKRKYVNIDNVMHCRYVIHKINKLYTELEFDGYLCKEEVIKLLENKVDNPIKHLKQMLLDDKLFRTSTSIDNKRLVLYYCKSTEDTKKLLDDAVNFFKEVYINQNDIYKQFSSMDIYKQFSNITDSDFLKSSVIKKLLKAGIIEFENRRKDLYKYSKPSNVTFEVEKDIIDWFNTIAKNLKPGIYPLSFIENNILETSSCKYMSKIVIRQIIEKYNLAPITEDCCEIINNVSKKVTEEISDDDLEDLEFWWDVIGKHIEDKSNVIEEAYEYFEKDISKELIVKHLSIIQKGL